MNRLLSFFAGTILFCVPASAWLQGSVLIPESKPPLPRHEGAFWYKPEFFVDNGKGVPVE